MIVNACLLLMFALVLARPNSFYKPSYLATLAGVLSLSTWGFLGISTVTLDGLVGGSNWITLVRDMFATLSFWFYREAVARATGLKPFGSPPPNAVGIRRAPWLLVGLLVIYAVPFALIADRGATSPGFILERLGQPAVWVFATAYMAGILLLSVDALRMIRRPRGVLLVIAIGYVLVVVGCVVEIVYLTLAHLGMGGYEFRVSMYFAAELPFFAGIFSIGAAIAWNAIWPWFRYRWTLWQLLALAHRLRLVRGSMWATLRAAMSSEPRRAAFRSLIGIQNEIEAGEVILSRRDRALLDRCRRRFLRHGMDLHEVSSSSSGAK